MLNPESLYTKRSIIQYFFKNPWEGNHVYLIRPQMRVVQA